MPLKIVMVGPSRSSKSALSLFLCGHSEALTSKALGPTVGVRVVEAERAGTQVELWDVSGDQAYEGTWPAIQKDMAGVLFVYNPEVAEHLKELELW